MMIIGHGEHRPVLEALARELGIDADVIWAGYHEDDLAEHYRASDLLLFTARGSDEGHRAVLEAMACGVPVATYPIEGVDALVPARMDRRRPDLRTVVARCARRLSLLERERCATVAGRDARRTSAYRTPRAGDPTASIDATSLTSEAITFISTEIGVGSESTPTVVRVGWMLPKYSAYTSIESVEVALHVGQIDRHVEHFLQRAAGLFENRLHVLDARPRLHFDVVVPSPPEQPGISPVTGLRGPIPDRKSRSPTRRACGYGPTGFGARSCRDG